MKFSALNYHFESQCIPTPLAWYAHHLPEWLLKLGVAGTFIIEIPIPFLFFSPIRSLRLFAFYCQVSSQLHYLFYLLDCSMKIVFWISFFKFKFVKLQGNKNM